MCRTIACSLNQGGSALKIDALLTELLNARGPLALQVVPSGIVCLLFARRLWGRFAVSAHRLILLAKLMDLSVVERFET